MKNYLISFLDMGFIMENNSNLIVSANPGSGKTEYLANSILSLLDNGVKSSEILCLTFTRKAMGEMDERIRKKIFNAKKNYEVPEVQTFHSFALSLIKQRYKIIETLPERFMRYIIYCSMDTRKLTNYSPEYYIKPYPGGIGVGGIANALKLLKSYGIYPDKIDVNKIQDEINDMYSKNRGLKDYKLEEMLIFSQKFFEIFKDYENIKTKNYLDYNDYIVKAIEIMNDGFKKYPYVYVDEVQDISELERELISKSGEKLFLVGDKKQAIFGFQGGNTESFNSYINNPEFTKLEIVETHRLPDKISNFAIEFYSNASKTDVGTELSRMSSINKKETGRVDLIVPNKDSEVPDAVIRQVQSILSNSGENESIGIITRTNAQAENLSKLLTQLSLNHTKLSGSGVSDTWNEHIERFVRGIVFNDSASVIPMLYTPFAKIEFKEAVRLADDLRTASGNVSEMLPDHLRLLKEKFGKDVKSIEGLFKEWILPRSIEFSREAFETSNDINSTIRYYRNFEGKEYFRGFQDFINYIIQGNSTEDFVEESSRITLLTAHKAKGLEFDHVIYMPKYSNGERKSPIDLMVELALSQFSYSYDSTDKGGEENRIDFVAITRAKKTLSIITSEKWSGRYLSKFANRVDYQNKPQEKSEFVPMNKMPPTVNIPEDQWLINNIKTKMKKFQNLSYTMMTKVTPQSLEDFIITYILGIRYSSSSMVFGTSIHEMIETYITKKKKPDTLLDHDEILTWKNFMEYDEFIHKTYNGEWKYSELSVKKNLPMVFPSINEGLTLTGKIDGVYTYLDGTIEKHVLVDFKTSKKIDSHYVDQLALYSKLYSLEFGIELERVETEIAYLSLRDEKINIGRRYWKNDRIQPIIQFRALKNIEEYIKNFVGYRNSSDSFIRDIIKTPAESEVFKAFIKEIKKETGIN